jgi:segregation and condensation protein A
MSTGFQPSLDFAAAASAAEDGDALIIDIEGYEGPLHVLLALARTQKVDLMKLSVMKLAEQYLDFVNQARKVRFSLAADYLVMASWLAYLKSRLMLPKPERKAEEGPPPEDMAAALAFRLAKLDVMRRAVEALNERPQLRRDLFMRGDPQAIKIVSHSRLTGELYDLVQAYIEQRRRDGVRYYHPRPPQAYPLDDARLRLRHRLPELTSWTSLEDVAPHATELGQDEGPSRASFVASTLSASLELVKEGALEAQQLQAFEELYIRARSTARVDDLVVEEAVG